MGRRIRNRVRNSIWVVVFEGCYSVFTIHGDANKRQASTREVAQSKGCADMKKDDLLALKQVVSFSNVHEEPDVGRSFVPRPKEMEEIKAKLAPMLTSNRDDKQ
eukprot:scaffold21786_cov48-Attheya_sp.AAC.2